MYQQLSCLSPLNPGIRDAHRHMWLVLFMFMYVSEVRFNFLLVNPGVPMQSLKHENHQTSIQAKPNIAVTSISG